MAKARPVDVVTKIVSILEPLEPGGRARAIHAALTLLGDDQRIDPSALGGDAGAAGRRPPRITEKAFFDSKDPRTKSEQLAVAARYREEQENATASTRAELEKVITTARRNFDKNNYRRDLDNARRKGFFTSGTGKDAAVLSHYGQKYVDALPDRAAAKKFSPSGRGGRRRGRKKKTGSRHT